jgi:hypothetical protein
LLGKPANISSNGPPLAERALGDVIFHVKFTNPAGAPLPDLVWGVFYADPSPLIEYSFHTVATGPMADGKPGAVTIVQNGNIARSNIQPAVINLRPIGK